MARTATPRWWLGGGASVTACRRPGWLSRTAGTAAAPSPPSCLGCEAQSDAAAAGWRGAAGRHACPHSSGRHCIAAGRWWDDAATPILCWHSGCSAAPPPTRLQAHPTAGERGGSLQVPQLLPLRLLLLAPLSQLCAACSVARQPQCLLQPASRAGLPATWTARLSEWQHFGFRTTVTLARLRHEPQLHIRPACTPAGWAQDAAPLLLPA